jgi:NAD(P)-dependent dehydrogenase (short-subunit alcohol dehydrogenase family)
VGQFDGKVAFVTGAGRGQGRSHAVRLAAEGADVAIIDLGNAGRVEHPAYRTATAADILETKAGIEAAGRKCLAFEADVRDLTALQRAADETATTLGGIDYVIANAGICDGACMSWDIAPENWQTMIDVNLTGVFWTCKATVPHVRRRGPGGALVLVASSAPLKAFSGFSHYAAAKNGVRSLAMSLASELGPEQIRCNCLLPGAIETDMTTIAAELSGRDTSQAWEETQLIAGKVGVEDVTAALIWLLSAESRFVTGSEVVVDGGQYRH